MKFGRIERADHGLVEKAKQVKTALLRCVEGKPSPRASKEERARSLAEKLKVVGYVRKSPDALRVQYEYVEMLSQRVHDIRIHGVSKLNELNMYDLSEETGKNIYSLAAMAFKKASKRKFYDPEGKEHMVHGDVFLCNIDGYPLTNYKRRAQLAIASLREERESEMESEWKENLYDAQDHALFIMFNLYREHGGHERESEEKPYDEDETESEEEPYDDEETESDEEEAEKGENMRGFYNQPVVSPRGLNPSPPNYFIESLRDNENVPCPNLMLVFESTLKSLNAIEISQTLGNGQWVEGEYEVAPTGTLPNITTVLGEITRSTSRNSNGSYVKMLLSDLINSVNSRMVGKVTFIVEACRTENKKFYDEVLHGDRDEPPSSPPREKTRASCTIVHIKCHGFSHGKEPNLDTPLVKRGLAHESYIEMLTTLHINYLHMLDDLLSSHTEEEIKDKVKKLWKLWIDVMKSSPANGKLSLSEIKLMHAVKSVKMHKPDDKRLSFHLYSSSINSEVEKNNHVVFTAGDNKQIASGFLTWCILDQMKESIRRL
jgi:hypothetical protein